MAERIQKILSQWGIASRRQAEKMILAGRVRVNGTVAHLGQKADLSTDRLEVDGVQIKPNLRPQLIYILLNKPSGVVSTCRDGRNRPTVLDLLPAELQQGYGIHPVGRLDADSTGALILTNDGDLTLSLTHPRYHLPKTYEVLVSGHPSPSVLKLWREGVILSGKKTLPALVKILKSGKSETLLEIVLTEGRNRQIRRVADRLGFQVIELHRTAIGNIKLQPSKKDFLPIGQYRFLTDSELDFLQKYTAYRCAQVIPPP